MTDAQFDAWLISQDRIPVILVEVGVNSGGTEIVRKFSSRSYNSEYLPIANVTIPYTEQLVVSAVGGAAPTLSVGTVQLENVNGEFDDWLDDVWVNRPHQQFIGDVRWARSDFRMTFNGYSADLGTEDEQTFSIKVRDKMQQLNSPISEVTLGGNTPNKNVLIPSAFGELHNITPLLVDASTQEYQTHGSDQEGIIEARTEGKLRVITQTVGTGKFQFTTAVGPGAVTCDVQGDKFNGIYANTISTIVQRIVTGYGKLEDRLTTVDIELDTSKIGNFASFDIANPQAVGYYSKDRENVILICQYLASTIGAQIVPSMLGKLRIIQLTNSPAGTPKVVTISQMYEGDGALRLTERLPVVASIKLGYDKNSTVQSALQTSIPLDHTALFASEWSTVTSTVSATKVKYKLNTEPVQKDTAFCSGLDAQAEADRLLNLWSIPRGIYQFTGTADLLTTELGSPMTIIHPRYQMQAGRTGMVVSVRRDWDKGEVQIGVFI